MADVVGKPDALDVFIQELQRIREDVNYIEGRIIKFEDLESFDAHDVRYTRLLREKEMLLTNLCVLRTQLVDISVPKVNNVVNGSRARELSTVSRHGETPSLDSKEFDSSADLCTVTPTFKRKQPPSSDDVEQVAEQSAPAPTTMQVDDNHSNNASEFPQPQLEEYLEKKKEVAGIMRDFTEKKICFFARDGSAVFPQHYQQISIRVKEGEDIASFLRGTTLQYITGVDKKRNSVTEVKLFMPEFKVLRPQATNSNSNISGSSTTNHGCVYGPDINHANKRPNCDNNTNPDKDRNPYCSLPPNGNTVCREGTSTLDRTQLGRAWEGFTYK